MDDNKLRYKVKKKMSKTYNRGNRADQSRRYRSNHPEKVRVRAHRRLYTAVKRREAWLKERMKGVGASESSAVMGLNPYMSNIDLWEIKTGRKIPKDISEVSYVKYGNEAEAPLRDLFKLDFPQYEVKHREYTVETHPRYDFLRCSLDGKLIDKETGEVGVLEVKTTDILSSMHLEKWENDRIPDNYYIQVIHCMMVIGASFAILKAQLKTRYKDEIRLNIRHYRIDINEGDVRQDIEDLKQKLIIFWNEYVLKDKQPPRELPL